MLYMWETGSKIENAYYLIRKDWFAFVEGLHIDSLWTVKKA